MRASVVIPTYDRAAFLLRTLAGFARQRGAPDFELVIVDDGGPDPARTFADTAGSGLEVRYHRHATNRGTAASRNTGLADARGDIVIFCDDDRVPSPTYIADHVAAHDAHAAQPDGRVLVVVGQQRGLFAEWSRDYSFTAVDVAGVLARRPELAAQLAEPRAELVTPSMLRDDLDATLAMFAIAEPWWEAFARPIITAFGAELAGFAFPWVVGVTGNLSVPRAAVERIGGFDGAFVGWGLEDSDFHLRLHRAGAHTRVVDGATNYHQIHRRGPERVRQWETNAIRFLDKHSALDVCLYFAMVRRRLTVERANRIALEAAAIATQAPELIAELVRVHKERLHAVAQLAL